MKFSELQRLQRREGITVLSSDARIEQLEARLCTITKERDALRAEVESWKGLARQFGNEADAMRTHLSFAKDELNRSRAKIAEMEKQEPAG